MFLFLHKLLMALSTLFLLSGVSAAAFFRRNRYWLKIHKVFNSIAGIFLSAGALMAIAAVGQQRGEHLDGFHPIAGSITLGLAVISLFLGFYQFQAAKNRKPVFKTFHRWSGRFTVLMIIVTLIAGLIRAGII